MRDAIQGMLSMSRIGMPSTLVTSASPAEKSRLARGRRSETGETEPTDKNMPTGFKDSEFGEYWSWLWCTTEGCDWLWCTN